MPRARWHALTGALVLTYILADALIITNHRFISDASWLMVHLFTLGALTNALFIWTEHFSAAILRRRPDKNRRAEIILLAILNLGIVTLSAGMHISARWLIIFGTTALAAAVIGHAIRLGRAISTALPARFTIVPRIYLTSALYFIPGIACGFALALGPTSRWYIPALGAHISFNVLGWIGLPIIATLLTLWPTILRAQLPAGAERAGKRYLPLLAATPLIAAAGAALSAISAADLAARFVMAAGILGFVALAIVILFPLTRTTWRLAHGSYAAYSVAAGVTWLLATIAFTGVQIVTRGPAPVLLSLSALLLPLLAGGIAQVLLGSLGYLLPTMMGGGPKKSRVRFARLDRWATFRVVVINLSLILYLALDGSLLKVVTSLAAFAAALASVGHIIRAIMPVSTADAENAPPPWTDGSGQVFRTVRVRAGVLSALATVAALLIAAIAADPAGSGLIPQRFLTPNSAPATPTGEVTRVEVHVEGMRFIPAEVYVPRGNELEITLVNTGDQPHDLTLATGAHTPRLAPGERAELNAGIISGEIPGWCSIAGHRQMGMTFSITTDGDSPDAAPADPSADPGAGHGHGHGSSSSGNSGGHSDGNSSGGDQGGIGGPAVVDLQKPMDPARLYDPVLPALEPADGPVTREITLRVSELQMEAAPGLMQQLWTFNGTVPGPILHGRVGDTFVVTLINDGSMGHSIDFHAGIRAPDEPMRTIAPGESLEYRFVAEHAGIWMYHCATVPMSLHIANGMYGAVVIEPPELAPVDHSYVLIHGESYLGAPGEIADAAKIATLNPDTVHFNGYPDQYVQHPLSMRTGERARIWVLNTGPNTALSFHVVGGQFTTVFKEGAYLLQPNNSADGASQALGLLPAEGGFVELSFPEAGHYVAVNHIMSLAERGAKAVIEVSD